jgi:hypothetical protein
LLPLRFQQEKWMVGSLGMRVMRGDADDSSQAVFFATAGEKGVIKVWRSDSGGCVHESAALHAASGAAAGGGGGAASPAHEYTDLSLVPGGQSLLATTGDARLLFYAADAVRVQHVDGCMWIRMKFASITVHITIHHG